MLPFLLIGVHGYSAKAAGAAFLPFSGIIEWIAMGRRAGRTSRFETPAVARSIGDGGGFAILGLTGGVRPTGAASRPACASSR